MPDFIQLIIALVLFFLLDQFLKAYPLRAWLGVVLMAVGAFGCIAASQTRLFGLDLGLLSVFAVALGVGLFLKRRRFEDMD
nr:hypothetical protein [uncultured Pseudomonas sp.]